MLLPMPTPAVRFRLSKILKERKMTQRELAEISGVSRQSISKLTGYPRQVKLETLDLLSKALGIEPGDFFELEEEN